MGMQALEHEKVSIVLVGQFNPAIFTPGWLAQMNLINKSAFEAAETEVVHSEIAKFRVDDIQYEILKNRFQVQSSSEPFIRCSDLVAEIFGNLLPHTPLQKLGINFETHFKTKSPQQRLLFGRKLAPLEPWGSFGQRMHEQSADYPSGVRTILMQETNPRDRKDGHRQVRVETSSTLDPSTGVLVIVNDHFEGADVSAKPGATGAVSVLQDRFEDSLDMSRTVSSELMDYALELQQ